MRHHTKDKGDIGVLKAAAWFIENDYQVMQPLTEHSPFDLVVYREGLFWRVQVKYRTITNGCVGVRFASSWADRHGTHIRPMNRQEVDAVCVYEPTTAGCYFFSPREFTNRAFVWLRFAPVANNQTKHVRFASTCRSFEDRWAANWTEQVAAESA